MKKIVIILSILSIISCSSEKSVERETNKSKQIVVQKFLDEYSQEHKKLIKDQSEESLINNKEYIDFVSSVQTIKLAETALKSKNDLKESQIIQLEEIIKKAKLISVKQ